MKQPPRSLRSLPRAETNTAPGSALNEAGHA